MTHTLWQRLLAPYFFRVDFRRACWLDTPVQAYLWLAGAVLSDVSAQLLVGKPSTVSLLVSLATPALWLFTPARLAGAAGNLMVVQALGSIGWAYGLSLLGASWWFGSSVLVVWQGWSVAALIVMVLRYIRTPKSEMGRL